ncbi:1-acyl-sn-glycerol-3-phosphate acyltransferase [Hymenobacter sp. BT683]|uniref:1-acyl-sn-glycerol-3-phosphate acyltransferase n=1 Tax=Hymenobacter jeongseonensis TaxID=2791027 RepID=A0ABS0IJN2_9BACT|nr:lysophospholipid acyltransferase family protein [Hymenobacter jeongseonensis]MBF9238234.1 1-acyl-sn-glycerol-3-phosphate acyltransferase [Hymenobacter jeongseonensis]
MRHLLRYLGQRLYTTWATFWFIVPFVLTFPLQWFFSRRPNGGGVVHALNRFWSWFSITMWAVPVEVVRESSGPNPQPCVYVANHGSYIDIMMLFKYIPGFLNMMGKASLAKVPVWGPIFERVYITVDRSSAVSRGRAVVLARRTLAEGKSIAIFAEGRISPNPGKELLPLLDGAFLLAIEMGVPLVPVGMPLNHMFMPDVTKDLRVRHHRLKIVFHPPISTAGLTLADIPALKQQVAAQLTADFLPAGAHKPGPSTWRAPGNATPQEQRRSVNS